MRRMHIKVIAFMTAILMTSGLSHQVVRANEKAAAEAIDFEDTTEDTADLDNLTETNADYKSLAVSDLTETALYEYKAVAVTDNYITVYQEADESSAAAGKLYNNNVATVLGTDGDWCRVQSGSLTGYVEAENLVIGDEEAVKESAVLSDDQETPEYSYGETVEEEEAREEAESAAKRQALIDYALQFVGNPYVYGGSSLTHGTDCSGFVMRIYEHFGVSLPHSSTDMRSCGTEVSFDELQPGDIICYSGHVALYMGNGKIVHAANSATGIVTGDMYYRTPICARRIFN